MTQVLFPCICITGEETAEEEINRSPKVTGLKKSRRKNAEQAAWSKVLALNHSTTLPLRKA
jgi:hypothetical protein